MVSGRVQGVFYRASARDKAESLGVTGWVRNKTDGAVEILAEGEEAGLAAFVQWCGQGPRWARVEQMTLVDQAPTGEFVEFTVVREA